MPQDLHQIVHPLVDHDVIREATKTVQRLIDETKAAEADVAAARQAHQAAHSAHHAALHEGTDSPAKTKRALADAQEALDLAQEVRDARARMLADAQTTGVERARRQAYSRVMLEGVRRRMNAIRAAPAAHQALAAAEAEFKLGTQLLNEARAHHVAIPDEVINAQHGMRDHLGQPHFTRTEEQEQALWGNTLNIAKALEKGEPV